MPVMFICCLALGILIKMHEAPYLHFKTLIFFIHAHFRKDIRSERAIKCIIAVKKTDITYLHVISML